MTASVLSEHLRPGDRIMIGQATGEPQGLVAELFDVARQLTEIEVFCGYSLNTAWQGEIPASLRISTYCGLGTIGPLVGRSRAQVIPFSMSQLSTALMSGKMPIDVVLLQVAPMDAEGYHSLGPAVDYVWEAAQNARVVIVEVNDNIPATRSDCRLHSSEVVVALNSETPLPELPAEPAGELQSRVAREVARLVPDGATLQLGIGKLSAAIAHALIDRRGLHIRCGMVGDWFLELVAAGAIDEATPDSCLASLAVGSSIYSSLSPEGLLGFAPPARLVQPIAGSPFLAINSAIEVDLRGQANAEYIGDRYVGASSGQTDYFRAAHASANGLAILALPSVNERGTVSRIVPHLTNGYVTSAQSDVDIIITEHGIADIRATNFDQRKKLIANIADPQMGHGLR